MKKYLFYATRITFICAFSLSLSIFCIGGAVGGPKKFEGTLASKDSSQFKVTFKGGEEARISVIAEKEFSLVLHGEDGKMITSSDAELDSGPDGNAYVAVLSSQGEKTTTIKITVVNKTKKDNRFLLQTN